MQTQPRLVKASAANRLPSAPTPTDRHLLTTFTRNLQASAARFLAEKQAVSARERWNALFQPCVQQ